MKKLFSYIYPITKRINSDHNGVLELTLVNGRKVLDSKNANYSFGSLQRILEKGLSEIDLTNTNSILILGLGGGSVIKSLRNKFRYSGEIHTVEIDRTIIDIAKNEFDIHESEKLHIYNKDAFEYVKQYSSFYDLIIVDLFIDDKVPLKFYSQGFCGNLLTILSKKGTILFNVGLNESGEEKLKDLLGYFSINNKLTCNTLKNIEGTNTLLIINNF